MLAFLPGLASAGFAIAAWVSFRGDSRRALAATRAASLFALACAVAAASALAANGSMTSPWYGVSFRLDPLSTLVFALIAFVGHLVLEYSRNYLAGNDRHNEFMGHMALTIAAAVLMTTAGHLPQLMVGWFAMSIVLHQLLVFFGDRPRARIAAHKKFIVARLGDASLALAIGILWFVFGTADIALLLESARSGMPAGAGESLLPLAGGLIALAAILKSAQFPAHGWITEVMETPTPVSALLHAGIVNAGGFLVFRFADVIVLSSGSMDLLMIVGGFTALFGSVVTTAQKSIKVSLGYSTVGQMGFMLLQCGFGAFSSAGLHLVAHSLYKAHAFLASGTAVEQVKVARSAASDDTPGVAALVTSLVMALAIYLGVGTLFDHAITESLAVQTLGAIFIMGLYVFLARGSGARGLLLRTAPVAAVTAALYFTLQIGAAQYFGSQLPPLPPAGPAEKLLAAIILAAFAVVTMLQVLPQPDRARWYRALYVHLSNGLYANAVFDRLTGGLRRDTAN